ncbi:MAG: SDR family oxidoreductase [Alphaproteobacteria bacterium]|jgi:NAD(P)-dependent dehydrogenase (short-subunit alcohol dehydrogenase family)|nr:SDR family oxidoreductase [Alphaproteobacteria bacterium]MDP6515309.1 SDR family oxidoreductase [Alphaproteobacteria bacterium]
MAGRLEDKVAIVTGAGSIGPGWGNGKATAVLFAREGAKVVAVDRDPSAAEETRAVIAGEGGECLAHTADVAVAGEVAAMVAAAMAAYGRIDVLHNNVGIASGLAGPVATEEDDWDRVFAVNVKSMFLTAKHCLPIMERQGAGSIINISSIGAIRYIGIPYVSYASSKAAILQFTQTVALEYAAKGIRCNAILPGLMNTPMVHASLMDHYGDADQLLAERDAASPTGKMGDAWDIAYAALYLASDESKYVNAAQLVVDGGLSAKIG